MYLSELSWRKLPFSYRTTQEFKEKLDTWIGDVFYDILPEHGFEIREEQIFTSFQIAKALTERRTVFAEAGLGTGKTFAYLLPSLCYARFTGKPMILSSLSPVLQHQLIDPDGDVATISRILDLGIDVGAAVDETQFMCRSKVDAWRLSPSATPAELLDILDWAETTVKGERRELSEVSDETWEHIAWDESVHCDTCENRGICAAVQSRTRYRKATDFIVCDHGVFFRDLWSRDDKIEGKQVPLLPAYAGVVFDEGHKAELPAAMAYGRKLRHEVVKNIAQDMVNQPDVRRSMVQSLRDAFRLSKSFFSTALANILLDPKSERLRISRTQELMEYARRLQHALEDVQDELVTEESMHEELSLGMRAEAYQGRLDRLIEGFAMFRKSEDEVIAWFDSEDSSVWVVPRDMAAHMKEHLFSRKIPVVFSSGTLTSRGSTDLYKRMYGVEDPIVSRVGIPFNLQEQVLVYMPEDLPGDISQCIRAQRLMDLLMISRGRALVLIDSSEDRDFLIEFFSKHPLPFKILWEGEGDKSSLLDNFKKDISSVLIGSNYWEGVDIPGESLSLCVIYRLPFPSWDPLVAAKRSDAERLGLDQFTSVDVPLMGIRLKQGCGRLIRTKGDRGVIALLESSGTEEWKDAVTDAIPEEAPKTDDIEAVKKFFNNLS